MHEASFETDHQGDSSDGVGYIDAGLRAFLETVIIPVMVEQLSQREKNNHANPLDDEAPLANAA